MLVFLLFRVVPAPQADGSPPPPRVRIARKDIGIGQGECATVFFDDLFDNERPSPVPLSRVVT